jgi:hypothetical protein
MRPEEQSRLTVEIGTLSGIPAASAAARETYRGEGGWQVPFHNSFMTPRRELGAGTRIRTYANVVDRRRVQFGFLQSGLRFRNVVNATPNGGVE